jgi:peptidyl-prolyl cis-trans isomerase C
MVKFKNLFISGVFCTMLALNASAADTVVAKYNGKELHKSEIEQILRVMLNGALPEGKKDFSELSKDMRQKIATEFAQQKIVEEAMMKSNIKDSDVYKQHLEAIHKQISINLFLDHYSKRQLTDKATQAEYSNYTKSLKSNDEIKVNHILVNTENEAKEILSNINSSKLTFEKAAKEHSLDGSKSNGGEIGYISKGKTVPEFEKAAYGAKKGSIVGPVKTEFGWHLIKVTDSRKQKIPTLEEIKPQLEQMVLGKIRQQYITELFKNAKIETFVE